MGLAKTEKELREETRARRAKHDLKNLPLPLKRRSSLHDPNKTRLFKDANTSERNKKGLNSLMSQRVMNSKAHSRSMTDISQCVSGQRDSSLNRYSQSCVELADTSSLRRNRSYSRIMDQQNSLDQKLESYRSTMTDMFTNVKNFSPRSVSAISSDNLLKSLHLNSAVQPRSMSMSMSILPTRPAYHSSYQGDSLALRDPCWRARRINQTQQKYNWREKLGMEDSSLAKCSSSQFLSRSTPNIAHWDTQGRSRGMSLSELPRPVRIPTLLRSDYSLEPSGRGDINNSSKTSTDYMKKALRQLKVATSWLSNAGTPAVQTQYSHPPPLTRSTPHWSSSASHSRFHKLRAIFD